MTACDLEKSFTFDNKSSPKSFGKNRVTTPVGRKWTRPLRMLAVQCPLQTSPITQPRVAYDTSTTQCQCHLAHSLLAAKLLRHVITNDGVNDKIDRRRRLKFLPVF